MDADTGETEKAFEDHLDEITGTGPIDLSEDDDDIPTKVDAKDDESEPEPKEDDEPAPDIAAKAEDEELEEEPGNLRLPKAEEEPDAANEAETKADEPEESESDKVRAAASKREARLYHELRILRSERRQGKQTPPPVREPAPVPVAEPDSGDPTRIPVVVSEDGQSVYVDQEKLSAQMQASARSVYDEAMKPTPEQIRVSNKQQLERAFVGEDAGRKTVFDTAEKADDYISEMLAHESGQQGFQPRNIQDVQMFIRQSGISDKVEEFFPEITPMLDEFVAAYASDNPMWKRSVLERITAPSQEAPPDGSTKTLESVADTPRSLARKGGTRSVSPNSDEMEFEKLEAEFRKDAAFMPEKKYQRMQTLGKKLGRDGMD